MKRFALLTVFVLAIVVAFIGCGGADSEETFNSPFIQGLTLNNYPRTDGSTSTLPLNTIIACRLLGIDFGGNTGNVYPRLEGSNADKFWELVKASQTHESFINLIDNNADLILSARKMSAGEKAYADSKGVSLIETPIALDGFIFIVHPTNPIGSLTISQIQDIYAGRISRWNVLGGNNTNISPYVREPNSGSQELMESLVMKGLAIMDFPYSPDIAFSMSGAHDAVSREENAICYSLYYYKEYLLGAGPNNTKTIAINGINPDKESISRNSYPLVTEVYAVIRSDLSESSMAYKVYEWLQTEAGKGVISESGYVAIY